MRTFLFLLSVLAYASTAGAQTAPGSIDDLLQKLEALGQEAAKLRTPPAAITGIHVPAGGDLQKAINDAPDGALVTCEAGATYPGITIGHPITLQTQGWTADRLVLPGDGPALCTIQGRAGYGVWITGSRVTLYGLRILWNTPAGAGELVRIGDGADPIVAHTPDAITLRQLLLRGNPGDVYGQKRGIAANGRHVLIDQVYADNFWIAGQDSQAVAAWSTEGPIVIRRSVLSAASEIILIGGTPPAAPEMLPSDVTIEDNVLWKPRAWKGKPRQVKNLLELKFGRRILVRRNWLENNWPDAQAGSAVLLTMAINGRCDYCELTDVTFEDNVVWRVASGLNILGYSYIAAYGPSGQAHGLTIRNNLWYIDSVVMGGDGRAILMGGQPKDLAITRNTFVYSGNSFLNAYYGMTFPAGATVPVAGGPVTGLVFADNVARHSSYGVFTPDGSAGLGLATFFPGGVFSGNVLGGTPTAARARYDATAGGALNIYPDTVTFDEAFVDRPALELCLKEGAFPGKGADCARLPMALRWLVPADPPVVAPAVVAK